MLHEASDRARNTTSWYLQAVFMSFVNKALFLIRRICIEDGVILLETNAKDQLKYSIFKWAWGSQVLLMPYHISTAFYLYVRSVDRIVWTGFLQQKLDYCLKNVNMGVERNRSWSEMTPRFLASLSESKLVSCKAMWPLEKLSRSSLKPSILLVLNIKKSPRY